MWFRIVMLVYQRVLFSYLWKSLEVQISGWMLGMLWFKCRGTDIFHIIKYERICLGCPVLVWGPNIPSQKPAITSPERVFTWPSNSQCAWLEWSKSSAGASASSGHRWSCPDGIPALQSTGPHWAPHIVTISIGWAGQFQAILKTSKN